MWQKRLNVKKKSEIKSLTQAELDERYSSIQRFKENLFLYCGINLSILKLATQTQGPFWFMLFK